MSNYKIVVACLVVLVASVAMLAAASVMSGAFFGAYPLEYTPNLSAEDIIEYKVHINTYWSGIFKTLNIWALLVFVLSFIIMTWSLSKSRIPPIIVFALGGWFVWTCYVEHLWLEMAQMSDDPMRLEQLVENARHQTTNKGRIAIMMCIAMFEGWLRRKRPKPPPPPPPEKKGKKK